MLNEFKCKKCGGERIKKSWVGRNCKCDDVVSSEAGSVDLDLLEYYALEQSSSIAENVADIISDLIDDD